MTSHLLPLSRIAVRAALLGALLGVGACRSVDAGHRGQIEHVVVVWLKEPGDEAVKARTVETARTFPDRIPGILSLAIGDALPSERPEVDDGFDLTLVIRFADAAALAAYLVHPVHQAAVHDVLAPNAARVQIYDVALR